MAYFRCMLSSLMWTGVIAASVSIARVGVVWKPPRIFRIAAFWSFTNFPQVDCQPFHLTSAPKSLTGTTHERYSCRTAEGDNPDSVFESHWRAPSVQVPLAAFS